MDFDAEGAVAAAAQAAQSSGRTSFSHLMSEMVRTLRDRSRGMPNVAVEALAVAELYWQRAEGTAEDLATARVACWAYLKAKNGSSSIIEDDEDRLVRSVLCVLYSRTMNSGTPKKPRTVPRVLAVS